MLISLRTREPEEIANLIESDRWTVGISTAHAEYPATKLLTDNLDDVTRTWGTRRSHNRIRAEYTSLSEPQQIDYVAVLGINRDMPTAPLPLLNTVQRPNETRLIIDTNLGSHEPQVLASGFALTNLTGAYTVLNQVLHPPEETPTGGYTPLALEATNNGNSTSVTGLLDNSPARPIDGDQVIYVHVRDSVDIEDFPTIDFTLRQNGVDLATLAYDEIETSSEGFIYKYTWNSSLLPDTNEFVGFRIDGYTTGTSTVEPLAVHWYAEVSGTLFDSGWQTIDDAEKVVWAPNVEVPADDFEIIVYFSDFGYVVSTSIANPFSPPPFVTVLNFHTFGQPLVVGRFAAGSAINVPLVAEGGFNLRRTGNNQSALVQSRGGGLRAQRNDMTWWAIDFTLIPQSQARFFGELTQLFKTLGHIIPTLFIADHDGEPEELIPTAFWALVSELQAADMGLIMGSDYPGQAQFQDKRFDVRLSVVEMNAHSTKKDE